MKEADQLSGLSLLFERKKPVRVMLATYILTDL